MAKTPDDGRLELLQGTLDVLILKTLRSAPMHGWGISQRIQQLSEDVLQVNQGSLYPALYRLEGKGWIRSRRKKRAGSGSRRRSPGSSRRASPKRRRQPWHHGS